MQIIKNYRIEGQARDTTIVQLVHRHGVITSDLVQLALSRERFDLPGESRAAVLNRLTILANRGYFHRLGRSHSGHIVYGTRRPRKRAQPQLEHSLIGARFGTHIDLASIDRCITITDLVSDQTELRLLARKEGWQFVPDRIFTLAGVRYFCEFDNSTESDDKILAKVEAYKGFIRRKRQRREMLEKLGESKLVHTGVVDDDYGEARREVGGNDGGESALAHVREGISGKARDGAGAHLENR